MGGCCSCTEKAQVATPIENIFDVLPRDPLAPSDLFKPLDIHFARNHTVTNLLQLYPSRRLPSDLVSCMWRHYFSPLVHLSLSSSSAAAFVPPAPPPPPSSPPVMNRLPSLATDTLQPPDSHASSLVHSSAIPAGGPPSPSVSRGHQQHHLLHPAGPGPPPDDGSRGSGGGSASASVSKQNSAAHLLSRGEGDSPDSALEIQCMQHFLTDILRHDLASLKERYDEVLAASLALPSPEEVARARDRAVANSMAGGAAPAASRRNGGAGSASAAQQGFSFNPAPVLAALRTDVQRLDNLPLEHLARTVLREMKGGSSREGGDERGEEFDGAPRKHSHSQLQPMHSQQGSLGGAGGSSSSAAEMSPLDRPVLSPASPVSAGSAGGGGSFLVPPALSAKRIGAGGSGSGGGSSGGSSTGLSPRTPRPSAPPALLSLVSFSAHVDHTLRALFDRFYRKGFWILFSLNLMHHAHKILALAKRDQGLMQLHQAGSGGESSGSVVLQQHRSPVSSGGGVGSGGGIARARTPSGSAAATWSDRIASAVEAQEAVAPVRLRKMSESTGPHSRVPTPTNASTVAAAAAASSSPVSPAAHSIASPKSGGGVGGGALHRSSHSRSTLAPIHEPPLPALPSGVAGASSSSLHAAAAASSPDPSPPLHAVGSSSSGLKPLPPLLRGPDRSRSSSALGNGISSGTVEHPASPVAAATAGLSPGDASPASPAPVASTPPRTPRLSMHLPPASPRSRNGAHSPATHRDRPPLAQIQEA